MNDTELKPSEQNNPDWLTAQATLAEWYGTPLGSAVIEQLQRAMGETVGDLFGYQALQVGNPAPDVALFAGSGLYRTLILDAPSGQGDVFGDVLALPVANGTMKCVLFFHALDFCAEPHQALREADRVLSDDGQLIVVGFNPYSLFGLRRILGRWRRQRTPWSGQFFPRWRVGEWLSVLDYAVEDRQSFFMRPPINQGRLLRRLRRFEPKGNHTGGLGGLYLLRARKQTLSMRLPRHLTWQPQRRGLASGLARNAGRVPQPVRARVAELEHYRKSAKRRHKP